MPIAQLLRKREYPGIPALICLAAQAAIKEFYIFPSWFITRSMVENGRNEFLHGSLNMGSFFLGHDLPSKSRDRFTSFAFHRGKKEMIFHTIFAAQICSAELLIHWRQTKDLSVCVLCTTHRCSSPRFFSLDRCFFPLRRTVEISVCS